VQTGGDALAGWPPLSVRGKRFFADAGVTVMREAGIDRAAVRDLIASDVRALQTAADPDAALAALAKPCTTRLDAAVPPLATPGLRQCAAIMTLAYDEIYAREGLSAAARDLKTLASVLSARDREALIAMGKTGDEADRALAEMREAIAAEAGDGQGGIDKYEVAHCYALAKPDEKTHY
jgi:alkylhydroperoxidase/carboxymuconolactone decarboxylase family protein YurZ